MKVHLGHTEIQKSAYKPKFPIFLIARDTRKDLPAGFVRRICPADRSVHAWRELGTGDSNWTDLSAGHIHQINPASRSENVSLAIAAIANEVRKAEVESTLHDTARKTPVHRQYPHAVLFGRTCGGTIIHPKWILTAGHCTLFTSGQTVLAGTGNTEDGSGVTRTVKKLYLHPKFTVGPYWVNTHEFGIKQVHSRWDFMLAELQSPLPLDGVSMSAVPLDTEADTPVSLPVDYSGFGAEYHGGAMQSEIHGRHLQTVSNERCASLPQYDKRDMMCAEGRTATSDSACNGDSGSGLVTEENRRLVGVVSWVQDDAHGCSPGKLVVFSRVSAARPWIKQVTGLDL